MSLVSGFGVGYFVLFPKRRGKVAVYVCLFVCLFCFVLYVLHQFINVCPKQAAQHNIY